MGENKFILPFAILFACFILWGIFYTSRINNKNSELKEETVEMKNDFNDIQNENNHYDGKDDFLIQDYDLSSDGREEIMEMMKKQTGSNQSYEIDINSKDSDILQEKVDLCLLIEDERYKNIVNTRLNIKNSAYVGDIDFLKYWKMYEGEHEKEKAKCYQLYFD